MKKILIIAACCIIALGVLNAYGMNDSKTIVAEFMGVNGKGELKFKDKDGKEILFHSIAEGVDDEIDLEGDDTNLNEKFKIKWKYKEIQIESDEGGEEDSDNDDNEVVTIKVKVIVEVEYYNEEQE